MSDNRSDLENAALALYYYAAELVKEGKTSDEVVAILVERGVSQESAETIMTRLNISRDNVARRSGYRSIGFGMFIIILMLLPLFGIFLPTATGASVIILILVMAVGFVIVGRGVMQVLGL
ncbi:MAG: hypothetical protein Phog2KO_34960 [Phototrophicaceae bacterium]